MKGTPATAARPAASVALFAALLLAATACSSSPSGPTSAQAGKWLQTDLENAVKGYKSTHSLAAPFTVTSDGTKDMPCGKGKARRVYSTQERLTGNVTDPPYMLGEVEKMAGYLERSDIYQADIKAQEERGPVTVTEKATSTRHHAQALITGKAVSKAFVITLQGTSDCLRTS